MCKSESSLAAEVHMHLYRRLLSGFIDLGPNAIYLDGSEVQVPACKIYICPKKSEHQRKQPCVQHSSRIRV